MQNMNGKKPFGKSLMPGKITIILKGYPRLSETFIVNEILELDRKTLDAIAAQHPQVPKILREVFEQRVMSPEEVKARGSGAAPGPGS